jgi:spore germination protein
MKPVKLTILTLILSCLLCTVGCSPYVENNLIEELSPVIWWSIGDAGNGQIKITTLVPPLISEPKRVLIQKVTLIKEGGKDFNVNYYREVKSGQLRLVFIEEDLAKKGLIPIINTLFTDPEISQRLYVSIVKGKVEDYMKNQAKDPKSMPPYYIYRMFQHYEKKNQGEMSIVNLHQVMKKLYSRYSNPIMPVFKVTKEDFIYEGTAFFRGDKLQGSVQKLDDQIFQLIDHDHYLKNFTIPELNIMLGHVRSDTHMQIDPKFTSLSIKVNLTGRIEEYKGDHNLSDAKELETFKHEIESYLEKQTTDLLKKMQKWAVDPLQIGNLTISPFSQSISEKEWMNHWDQMNIKVQYHIQIQPLTNVKK